MPFSGSDTYDVFITHAWRYHDDWNRISSVLDNLTGFKWRNFSVPWYDPAMDPNTKVGGDFVRNWLESQILPCHAILFLDSVYSVRSARKWLDAEVEMARASGKPIIALPSFGAPGVGMAVASMVDAVIPWDGGVVAQAIASVSAIART
jgi:hypothetical protein